MTKEEFQVAITGAHTVYIAARTLAEHVDLSAAIAAIDQADALGPIMDPTLYRDKRRAMDEDRDVLSAVKALAELLPRG